MCHLRLARGFFRVVLVVLLSSLSVSAFAADGTGGVQSGGAGIMLRAVLAQSLSMSIDPQPWLFDSFIGSASGRDFPVTIKAHWVRGPGNVSVAILSSSGWTGFDKEQPLSVIAPAQSPAMEIESGKLPVSADNKNEVLTIRAQVI